MKRVTIADVAKRAGVSKSTVSHTLSGKRSISEKTRQRVLQAIDELGYRPNPVAQRLAGGGQTRTIGLLFPLTEPNITGLEMRFFLSAANVINRAGYAFLLLTHLEHDSQSLERIVRSGLVDGVVLMEVYMHDPRVRMLQREGLPFVLIGRCEDNNGLTLVDIHIEKGMWICVEHLTQLGHRAIAYLHRQTEDYGLEVRALQGFSDACRYYDMEPITLPCAHTPKEAEASMNDLLDRHPEITAVIVWHDTSAWGVVQAATDRGCRIPEDLSIICGDYQTATTLFPFTPTTVRMGAEHLAATGADMIVKLLEGQPIDESQVLIPIEFVVGESTAPPRPDRVCR